MPEVVSGVANNNILPDFEKLLAGLIAGSIPIMGIWKFFRKNSSDADEAVLQATIIISQPSSTNFLTR